MKFRDLQELLAEPKWNHLCFAEQDGAEGAGGSGGEGAATQCAGETAEAGEGEEGAEVDDSEDVDYEGETYRLPKKLKDALLRNADYTQKTQSHAEKVRADEQRIAGREATAKQRETLADDVAEEKHLARRLKEYEKVDWDAWAQQDAAAAQRAQVTWSNLQREQDGLKRKIETAQGELRNKDTQANAEKFRKANIEIGKHIKDWGQPKALTLAAFAKNNLGYTDDELEVIGAMPGVVRSINDAYNAHQAKNKAIIPTGGEKKPAIPVTRIGASKGSASTAPTDKDDHKTWLRKRNAQDPKIQRATATARTRH